LAPEPGDIYRISTTKPFRTDDWIRFTVQSSTFSQTKANDDLDAITVVPNPYIVGATWEPPSIFKIGRGEHRIFFTNLPSQCTIRIYTVRGYLVDTIVHNGMATNIGATTEGAVTWDLVSKDGQDIAYGVYIYHVDAPGIGEKIGKFAVIK
ncbi:hypothetical protein H8E88_16080, partial [candidate division KSB1 bacterium]|nr:hypothetical protein [candidate division KSB1 bacterium]